MSDHEDTGERFMHFHALYRDQIKSEFDALEFAEDRSEERRVGKECA